MIDNILYINLEKRADRKTHMEKQLNNLGIPHERIQAIKPDDIENKAWWLKRSNFKTMSKSPANTLCRVSCLLSHIKTLKHLVKNKLNNCLILEDDIIFLENFNINIQIPDCFIAYLGYSMDKKTNYVFSQEWNKINDEKIYGAFAYFIPQYENAAKILELLESVYNSGKGVYKIKSIDTKQRVISQPYDLFLLNIIQKNTKCILNNPPFITHGDFGSDITSKTTSGMKFHT